MLEVVPMAEHGEERQSGGFEPFMEAAPASEALKAHGVKLAAKTLYQWAVDGRLPSHKVGFRRYFRLSELLRAIETMGAPKPVKEKK